MKNKIDVFDISEYKYIEIEIDKLEPQTLIPIV